MAGNLDDFFAKKDRKKGKSKKFTTEDLARKIEDTSKLNQSQNQITKKKDYFPGNEDENGVNVDEHPEEDEWKDFQEEERKDYSGLKIGNLQISDDDQFSGDGDGAEYGSDGEITSENQDKGKSGPWKKISDEADKPVVKPQPQQPQQPKLYISPALKNAQSTKLKKGVLPDINDVEFFPVLGSAKPEEVKKKKPEPGFEEVKHGSRLQRSSDLQSNAPVSIGNRFGSLADS